MRSDRRALAWGLRPRPDAKRAFSFNPAGRQPSASGRRYVDKSPGCKFADLPLAPDRASRAALLRRRNRPPRCRSPGDPGVETLRCPPPRPFPPLGDGAGRHVGQSPSGGQSDPGRTRARQPGVAVPAGPRETDQMAYAGQIRGVEGYAWPMSAAPGGWIDLHVSALAARAGDRDLPAGPVPGGRRLIACLPGCGLERAAVLGPATRARSGHGRGGRRLAGDGYDLGRGRLAERLLRSPAPDHGGPRHGDSAAGALRCRPPAANASAIVVLVPINTWQAYDGWGGNSLYDTHQLTAAGQPGRSIARI